MTSRNKKQKLAQPSLGWAVYLRTNSDENQKPELSRSRQRFMIEKSVLERSDLPLYSEYVDVLTGKTPNSRRLSKTARGCTPR